MISAKVIAASMNTSGNRMLTFEVEYPRFILAELNTHRMLSKNSASSRAIPVDTMLKQVRSNPVMPSKFGKNMSGMQSKEYLDNDTIELVKAEWLNGAINAANTAEALHKLGLHKQWSNRGIETYQTMKTVISGTEWDNFYHLRAHSAAQPEIEELARAIRKAATDVNPILLMPGEWHLPYIDINRTKDGIEYYSDGVNVSLEDAIKVSVSCCAQTSYRKTDTSLEKATKIYDMLIKADVMHSSPFEHQATPMAKRSLWQRMTLQQFTEPGITHVDANGNRWSGNLRGWIQHRKLIRGEAVW